MESASHALRKTNFKKFLTITEAQIKSSENFRIKLDALKPRDKGLGIEPIPEEDENKLKIKESTISESLELVN